jgi:hypothetical protein
MTDTDTPAARKPGRPATGRDPVVSIRLPKRLTDAVAATALHVERPAAEVYREALYLGLQFMKGERVERGEYLPPLLRPKHAAEIHEAGHAAAMFVYARELEVDPAEVVRSVALKPRQGGYMQPAVHLPPDINIDVTVAGAVAQAIDERVAFLDIWNGHGCTGDRKTVAKLLRDYPNHQLSVERAVKRMEAHFADPDIWDAVIGLASMLDVHSKHSGERCWDIFAERVQAAYDRRDRAAEHMGPVIDEDVVKRPRRRVAKKKPRSR